MSAPNFCATYIEVCLKSSYRHLPTTASCFCNFSHDLRRSSSAMVIFRPQPCSNWDIQVQIPARALTLYSKSKWKRCFLLPPTEWWLLFWNIMTVSKVCLCSRQRSFSLRLEQIIAEDTERWLEAIAAELLHLLGLFHITPNSYQTVFSGVYQLAVCI